MLWLVTTGVGYGSLIDLLERPDITRVIVSAQPEDQGALVREAIEAGRDVLVEMPLGLTVAEAEEIALSAAARGVSVSVGFMKRHAPAYRRFTGVLDEGSLGRLRSFRLSFACDSTAFTANEREYLLFAAIHMVDLVRFLFGEVDRVEALSASDDKRVALAVVVRMSSRVVGSLDLVGLPGHASENESIVAHADDGWVRSTGLETLEVHARGDGSSWGDRTERTEVYRPAESAMSGGARDLYLRGFVAEVAEFDQALRAGVEPENRAESNVETMRLCDRILGAAARQSA